MIGFDVWPELQQRAIRRRAPMSVASTLGGAVLGLGYLYLVVIAVGMLG